ncbi:MAG TPA: helix-turn-helix domain-containing protein [Humisphaera sp.]|jgi:HTH-type transcriptional regulator/antitoxin HigA|nr:helix-turn-helix domain-containing protein [Humisphaera sp.]
MARSSTKISHRQRDTYMELIQEFPLKTIKNDADHARAIAVVSRLIGRDLEAGAGDYLDTLLVLVNKYEGEHHAIEQDMTPREALRALMEANQLTQADIGRIIGSESAVSMFLSGGRELSKSQIKKLATRFKLDPMAFIG